MRGGRVMCSECGDNEAIGSDNGVGDDKGVGSVEMVRVGAWVNG